MTSPDKPGDTLRKIINAYKHIPLMNFIFGLYRDSKQVDPTGKGISRSKLYEIIQYGFDPKPDGRVEDILKKLIAELKQKYPLAQSESKVTKK